MQNKFTAQAEQAIDYAHDIMGQLRHSYLGTEHLLIGLIKVENSVAKTALEKQGITEDDLIEKIREIIGFGQTTIAKGKDFTPRVKRILEASYQLSKETGIGVIGTEHLLICLLKEHTCVGVKLLESLSVDTQKLLNTLMKMIDKDSAQKMTNFNTTTKNTTKSLTPTLDKYSRPLNELAKNDEFDPIIGREKEIERIIQILSRRTKNNPCLVGEPGVGKTAVVEGLAQKIVEGVVPELLKDKEVKALDLAAMISGTKYRGEFEERINKVLGEIKSAKNIVLFIDELHTIIGAGAAEGAMDASNILKPALARGEVQVIGATTLDEYRKHIEKDAALERRFQPIQVEEPTLLQTISILEGVKDKYEMHHQVQITDTAIKSAVNLSDRYISDRHLPDKAIDLLDEAASRVRLRSYASPEDVKELEEELENYKRQKEEAIINESYEEAAHIKQKENQVKEKIAAAKVKWESKQSKDSNILTEEDIAEVVSSWTNIPVKRLAQEESSKLKQLGNILHEQVIGQDEAVKAIARAIKRGRVGLKDPARPIGSFLFLGPTGVGKTELTKVLAQTLFADKNAMIRIDMSEYMEKHTVSKLIGSPPGYVGYEEGGQLTEKVRRKPYSVILFDEIEKAHPDVFNILLQILDDGHITDSTGRKVNFKNTIIIMTSNIGARSIIAPKRVGFNALKDAKKDYEAMKKNVMEEVKHIFRPEFLNRIDETIVFHPLQREHIIEIAKIMINQLTQRIEKNTSIEIELDESVLELLVEKGYDEAYGARPLRRAIQTYIEDRLADEILTGNILEGDRVIAYIEEDEVVFKR